MSTAWVNRQDTSNTVTSSGNTDPLNMAGFGQVSFTANVSAISGTSPTIQFGIQASDDGTNWNNVHDTRRFTTTGANRISGIRISSQYYRYTWTITGTTPSVSFTISSSLRSFSPTRTGSMHRYGDIDLTTLNATSTVYFAAGNSEISVMVVRPNDGIGLSSITIEASNDSINWGRITGALSLSLGETVVESFSMQAFRYYRIRTSGISVGASNADLFWASTGGS